ncbi:hypothetical protein ACLMJK_006157 [Lecanora helva]
MANVNNQDVSETSPLLSKAAGSEPIEPHLGTRPDTIISTGHTRNGEEATDDREAQADDDGHAPQYKGIPEVKARLKYILPAIGIGVGQILQSSADQTIIVACYGKIGSDLKALNSTSWIATG